MHHQDFSGDPPSAGSRKTVFHYRRGSGGGPPASSTGAGVNVLEECSAPAGASSPGPHQQASSQMPGAQVKKKSGFQITSVTSAQINISGSNSLADDTESYDDLDESHTEDLSSSDILDASASRATDTGVPERSSSDETLNSLHGVDTPGLVSPNEPQYPHSGQGAQNHTTLVNGTVHHHYYAQQHSLPNQHRSDNLAGGESSSALPLASVSSSSQPLSKTGANPSQNPPASERTKPVGGTAQPSAAVGGRTAGDAHLQGTGNFQSVSSVTPLQPPGQPGFDNTCGSGPTVSIGGGTSQSATTSSTQTQTTTSSRFRVVKLDTNSEPFRKGRWTCTEYYEKEIPPAGISEAPKAVESSAETESSIAGVSSVLSSVQHLHTLQPYQLPNQEYTGPHTMQSPPQAPAQTSPFNYMPPQEAVGAAHTKMLGAPGTLPATPPQGGMSQHPSLLAHHLPYAVDQQQGQAPESYIAPQLTGLQPDFIQPTAPFQTQVQPPVAHVSSSISPGSAVTAKPLGSLAQQSPHQGHVAPPAAETSVVAQQKSMTSTSSVPAGQGAPYMPLTALQADLQPLLTPGTALYAAPLAGGSPLKASQLEDAQKLLFQHQGLLGLPRLGAAGGGVIAADTGVTARSLAHMGMSMEASALVAAAAAAGLRTQHAEGEEDRPYGNGLVM
ncbi:TSC22 domain family protein 1-like isoform X2 [Syngnathoides biaculeatus]|uniref:TSC22 domain family protein 1-like isoform X2 n=1 Tax=Syngnathoides biaculeatus TaxID=300417 RepID=UPI002ADDE45C|nr:TSC22 domain family protein 1-like isoform X2 [Syngnathoides biaculeatus]